MSEEDETWGTSPGDRLFNPLQSVDDRTVGPLNWDVPAQWRALVHLLVGTLGSDFVTHVIPDISGRRSLAEHQVEFGFGFDAPTGKRSSKYVFHPRATMAFTATLPHLRHLEEVVSLACGIAPAGDEIVSLDALADIQSSPSKLYGAYRSIQSRHFCAVQMSKLESYHWKIVWGLIYCVFERYIFLRAPVSAVDFCQCLTLACGNFRIIHQALSHHRQPNTSGKKAASKAGPSASDMPQLSDGSPTDLPMRALLQLATLCVELIALSWDDEISGRRTGVTASDLIQEFNTMLKVNGDEAQALMN